MSGEMTRERFHHMLEELDERGLREILQRVQASLPHTDDMARQYLVQSGKMKKNGKGSGKLTASLGDLLAIDEDPSYKTTTSSTIENDPFPSISPIKPESVSSSSFVRAQTNADPTEFRRRSRTEVEPMALKKEGGHVLKSKRFVKLLCDVCDKPMSGLLKQGFECILCMRVFHPKCTAQSTPCKAHRDHDE